MVTISYYGDEGFSSSEENLQQTSPLDPTSFNSNSCGELNESASTDSTHVNSISHISPYKQLKTNNITKNNNDSVRNTNNEAQSPEKTKKVSQQQDVEAGDAQFLPESQFVFSSSAEDLHHQPKEVCFDYINDLGK